MNGITSFEDGGNIYVWFEDVLNLHFFKNLFPN